MQKIKHFLDYEASQEETVLAYYSSYMILAVHSYVLYNRDTKARIILGWHFFMLNYSELSPNNGSVLNIA